MISVVTVAEWLVHQTLDVQVVVIAPQAGSIVSLSIIIMSEAH